jgi:pimeloyl-ACP methyl ester carboxylesterase
MGIHFIHARSANPNALPILISHGWPGSFLEMLKLIPLLADPVAHGADARDSFHVVVPSLPGFGFSDRPRTTGFNTFSMAHLFAELMTQLGYERFVAQGGDFGAGISTILAWKYPQRVTAFHLNYIPGSYRPHVDPTQPITNEEQAALDADDRWMDEKGAYSHVQRTQADVAAAALNDSPMGLAAWLIDKFRDWADCELPDGTRDLDRRFSKDELLANVSLYWFTETIGSSMRLYRESSLARLEFGPGERIAAPCGVARFAKEEPFMPESWVRRVYNVQRWKEIPTGGHFAAWEEPELLAQELREFFGAYR